MNYKSGMFSVKTGGCCFNNSAWLHQFACFDFRGFCIGFSKSGVNSAHALNAPMRWHIKIIDT